MPPFTDHASRFTASSRSEFVEQLCIRHHVANEVATLENAQRSAIRIGFGEAIQFVATADGTVNHDWLGMPAVGLHRDWC